MHRRKIRVVTILVLGVLLLASDGFAQNIAQRYIKVSVPFDFTVNQKQFHSGDYLLACAVNRIELRDSQGQTVAYLYPHSVQAPSGPQKAKLVFSTLGDGHALWQVWTEDSRYGYELAAPKPELIMAKQHSTSASPIKTGGNLR